jgi:Concanavalin A-like lectin/glucanases superfamily
MGLDRSCRSAAGPRGLMQMYSSGRLLHAVVGFAIVIGTLSTVMVATGCNQRAASTSTGMAVSFDGSTAEVSIPVVTQATENVTLESWVKLPAGAKGCFLKIGDDGTGYGIGVGASHTNFDASNPGNALIGLFENSGWFYPAGDPTLSDGAWHHVAFVIGAAGSAPTFYIDGTPSAATASGTPHAPANGAVIGKDLGGDRSTNATLAKVAIYSSALSADRIKAHATATSDDAYDSAVLADKPVAFYELNEENGPSAVDSSGNSNTGTYDGKVAFLQLGPFASSQQPASPATAQQPEATSTP